MFAVRPICVQNSIFKMFGASSDHVILDCVITAPDCTMLTESPRPFQLQDDGIMCLVYIWILRKAFDMQSLNHLNPTTKIWALCFGIHGMILKWFGKMWILMKMVWQNVDFDENGLEKCGFWWNPDLSCQKLGGGTRLINVSSSFSSWYTVKAGWETKKFWHSPKLGCVLYNLYKIPLAQACYTLARPYFPSHWRAGER